MIVWLPAKEGVITIKSKRKPTSKAQARVNERNSRKNLSSLISENFNNNDFEVVLTYKSEFYPKSVHQATCDIQNYFRRLRRLYGAYGIELKYIWIMGWEKSTKRIYFHTYISRSTDELKVADIWKLGYSDIKAMSFGENGLPEALNCSRVGMPTYRRWSGSKNLKNERNDKND